MNTIAFMLFVVCVLISCTAWVVWNKRQEMIEQNLLLHADMQKLQQRVGAFQQRFGSVIEVEKEILKVQRDRDYVAQQLHAISADVDKHNQTLTVLQQEIHAYQEDLDLLEMGAYDPHFEFSDPQRYKIEIENIRDTQKMMIKTKTAVVCSITWNVGGSASEGQKFADKIIKLTSRAFNNECEACIANATWSNYGVMTKRIEKAFDDLNKLNQINTIEITPMYKDLKLTELRLVHEHRLKAKEIKDEIKERQQEEREREREEQRLQKDKDNAAHEEQRYQTLLDLAQRQVREATAHQSAQNQQRLAQFTAQMAELEDKLAQAHAKSERAKSMAQQTKAGHVYIISNIGSFGENVYKIGMTRRVTPQDRVDELGDASVPFVFDVHAMIYTTNAPEMERALHETFSHRRVNMINHRKEFFNVSLEEIKREVIKIAPQANFTTVPEAQHYRQSMPLRTPSTHVPMERVSTALLTPAVEPVKFPPRDNTVISNPVQSNDTVGPQALSFE